METLLTILLNQLTKSSVDSSFITWETLDTDWFRRVEKYYDGTFLRKQIDNVVVEHYPKNRIQITKSGISEFIHRNIYDSKYVPNTNVKICVGTEYFHRLTDKKSWWSFKYRECEQIKFVPINNDIELRLETYNDKHKISIYVHSLSSLNETTHSVITRLLRNIMSIKQSNAE